MYPGSTPPRPSSPPSPASSPPPPPPPPLLLLQSERFNHNGGNPQLELPFDMLAHICSLLPFGDLIFTVPHLSKALAAAVAQALAPRIKAARAHRKHEQDTWTSWCDRLKTFSVPLWVLQEARLQPNQRSRVAQRAAFHGDVAALRWALAGLDCAIEGFVCTAAVAGGQLEALQCARAFGCPWDDCKCFEYLSGVRICKLAAENGHLAVLQWVRAKDHPCPWEECTSSAAAAGGHLAVLQWARAQDPPCPWDENTCKEAAAGGHLAVLQWARAQEPPCPWDENTCKEAAERGHLAVLQWARAQEPPCPWDENTCRAAAERGHLAVLQWARAQEPPCPWDENTCKEVAAGGHLAVLQWARAQEPPCPWDENTCKAAAKGGHLAVLQWARAQEPPCPWDTYVCLRWTGTDEPGLAVEKWIRAQA
ncbi:hypothetical protein Rsub_00715 [Raphidocelis subcapitata]|uniref:Uncharacterized protein n=1 Tax=Raphidocelis subcapitata TaxID=307507 RepID=A0A2V0NR19_9CHLO|nr:hypothetical protein Rsub_00715 [Raphidocelis subcapitata]|eukprot:GBF88003.1 hypothetical protein Rsub_00715 [Raphidocelis subcapitata]